MSVEKMDTKIIQPPKNEIVQPQKMGLLVKTQFINHLDIHGVTMHG